MYAGKVDRSSQRDAWVQSAVPEIPRKWCYSRSILSLSDGLLIASLPADDDLSFPGCFSTCRSSTKPTDSSPNPSKTGSKSSSPRPESLQPSLPPPPLLPSSLLLRPTPSPPSPPLPSPLPLTRAPSPQSLNAKNSFSPPRSPGTPPRSPPSNSTTRSTL